MIVLKIKNKKIKKKILNQKHIYTLRKTAPSIAPVVPKLQHEPQTP
jgi:hypothetical protein